MDITSRTGSKTRNLTFLQLFEVLQEEYIVCELRSKIYPEIYVNKAGITVYPAQFWVQTMEKKGEKIMDISKRNFLPCIFDDARIRETYVSRIIPEIGYPRFMYKDACQQLIQEKWDMHNYYKVGAEVDLLDELGKSVTGTIVRVDLNNKRVEIRGGGFGVKEFVLDTVTRKLNF